MRQANHLELVSVTESQKVSSANLDIVAQAARMAIQAFDMTWHDQDYDKFMAVAMEAAEITQSLMDANEEEAQHGN